MSQQFIPQQPGPVEPAAPKRRRWPWIVGIVAAFFVGLGTGLAGNTTTASPEPAPTISSPGPVIDEGDSSEETTSEPPAEPAVEEPEPYVPTVKDFELTVVTLEKECFGSAGCNVTYEVELGYDGPALDPSTTYQVIYEVRGGEDGPKINTLDVTGDQYEYDMEEYISTSSSAVELTAVVTSIR